VTMFPVFATVPLQLTRSDNLSGSTIDSEPVFAGMGSTQHSGERRLAPAAVRFQKERHAS
jgi:hypothetical protein